MKKIYKELSLLGIVRINVQIADFYGRMHNIFFTAAQIDEGGKHFMYQTISTYLGMNIDRKMRQITCDVISTDIFNDFKKGLFTLDEVCKAYWSGYDKSVTIKGKKYEIPTNEEFELEKDLMRMQSDDTSYKNHKSESKDRLAPKEFEIDNNLFEKEYMKAMGFIVTKDDGQYGRAESINPKGKKVLNWNRDNHKGEKIVWFGIREDADTRNAFNGIVETREQLELLLRLTK